MLVCVYVTMIADFTDYGETIMKYITKGIAYHSYLRLLGIVMQDTMGRYVTKGGQRMPDKFYLQGGVIRCKRI